MVRASLCGPFDKHRISWLGRKGPFRMCVRPGFHLGVSKDPEGLHPLLFQFWAHLSLFLRVPPPPNYISPCESLSLSFTRTHTHTHIKFLLIFCSDLANTNVLRPLLNLPFNDKRSRYTYTSLFTYILTHLIWRLA